MRTITRKAIPLTHFSHQAQARNACVNLLRARYAVIPTPWRLFQTLQPSRFVYKVRCRGSIRAMSVNPCLAEKLVAIGLFDV